MRVKIFFVTTIFLISGAIFSEDRRTPLEIACSIANQILKDTSFELKPVIQKPQLGIQVINFARMFGRCDNKVVYALSTINTTEDGKFKFGLSYNAPIKIWINNKIVFENLSLTNFLFREIAYSKFDFQDTIEVELKKGNNEILIKTLLSYEDNKIYLKELSEIEGYVKTIFISPFENLNITWLFIGNFNTKNKIPLSAKFPPELEIKLYYEYDGEVYTWQIPPPNILLELVIKNDAIYKRESYLEWAYPNGIVLFSLKYLADYFSAEYLNFVKRACDFTYENYDLFKKQYFIYNGIRSTNYRLYRMGMLDDAAPVIPFIQLLLEHKLEKYLPIVNKVIDYVFNNQARLPDGTFCRPEPEQWTVWADDLFMSVPLLVRAGILYNDKKYFDDASKQIINFNKYLFDPEIGLYKHGWLSRTNERTKVFWGRANGWVVWATSEALLNLPKNHLSYKKIEQIFRQHLQGIVNYQDQSGMWHQVLDDKNSFEETSCTAMFIIGLSRGIINDWIDRKYSQNVFKAWKALENKIDSTGIVKDISCGTGIGTTTEFYKTRERFDNDPRGLGAVITAAIEVDKLTRFLKEPK